MRILVAEDDRDIAELIAHYIRKQSGWDAHVTGSGDQALAYARQHAPDLIVLDVMLPGLNGLDVLRRIRAESRVPVVMLTARGHDVDRIVGLEIGADDYLPKPFNSRELVARVRAILRRASPAADTSADRLRVGDVEIDRGSRVARSGGEPVDLTTVEFDLLDAFLRNAGRVVSREELSETVLGRELAPLDRSIDVHVSNLRRKLGRGATERIKAIRGVGYLYARPPDTGEA